VSVHEKIRLIREAKGLTQEQAAEKLGMSVSNYGDIERGDNDPKLSKLQKIADLLEIELADLVDLSDRGVLNVNFNKQGKYNVYISGSATELKEQVLINALKDKEIALLHREIEQLNKLIAVLEKTSG
jgi:transcriptional regulator with XRE-family HTH domain